MADITEYTKGCFTGESTVLCTSLCRIRGYVWGTGVETALVLKFRIVVTFSISFPGKSLASSVQDL